MISDDDILVDDVLALMAQRAFDALGEYSCSLPTRASIGKRWKMNRTAYTPNRDPETGKHTPLPEVWWLGEYIDIAEENTVGIKWRKILIL